ncbi:hypothetical protein IP68_13760 [Blastomonas sp. AAP25]|nr:hypothetical protein IP68_13760 [Blastomonas sp. AAP25]
MCVREQPRFDMRFDASTCGLEEYPPTFTAHTNDTVKHLYTVGIDFRCLGTLQRIEHIKCRAWINQRLQKHLCKWSKNVSGKVRNFSKATQKFLNSIDRFALDLISIV